MPLNGTMRGVVWDGVPYQMTVVDLPIPTIQATTDAIVRVTTAAICGSDLHVYHGRLGSSQVPWGMGHEAVGYISEIGNAVSSLSVGDYVWVPDTASDGHFDVNFTAGPAYGLGADFGYAFGSQAEYVRVPFADDSLFALPNPPNSTNIAHEYEYLLASDILPTAWAGLDYSGFQPGDTVAIFGAGPVGLLAAYLALYRGASRVYSVDRIPARLEIAKSIGAIPINFVDVDPVQQILSYEPEGVKRAVDCVGAEAVNSNLEMQQDIVINNMVAVAANHGGLGQLGIVIASEVSAGAPRASEISPNITFPSSDFFSKGLTLQAGPVDPKPYSGQLLELITTGRLSLDFLFTKEISIEEAPEFYRRFDQKEEIKVAIRFP